ncbi:MAG: hypothetical protein AAGU10_08285 [Methanosarcina mazei]
MSKIIEAVNAMIKNSSLIEDVAVTSTPYYGTDLFTYFFKYKSYIWSIEDYILDKNEGYFLKYYPGFSKVSDIIRYIEDKGIKEENYVKYDSSILKTIEAEESFTELYRIVKEKLHDVDKVLDDIIADM